MSENNNKNKQNTGGENLRLKRLQKYAADNNFDFIIIRSTSNIFWATQFLHVFDHEQAHCLIVSKDETVLHTDSRYINAINEAVEWSKSQIKPICSGDSIDIYVRDYLKGKFDNSANTSKKFKVGIENTITVNEFFKIKSKIDEFAELIDTNLVVEKLRQVKDKYEIDLMKKAQNITDQAFKYIQTYVQPGMTERQIKDELNSKMFELGATDLAFTSIIATGPNSANPHAKPGENVVEQGGVILFDFGAAYNGYMSDMTRTIFLGKPEEGSKLEKVFLAVRDANEKCQEMIKPGVKCIDVHNYSLEVMKQHGFDNLMGHGLGHGVGSEIHEEPYLNPKSDNVLEPGNVVTIEPGIYLAGEFGIRLEDFGVVTEDGFERFTETTHDMIVI